MISFENDYNNGVHPLILQRLIETNNVQALTYGDDVFSQSAKAKIKRFFANENLDIFFFIGGTQTNSTVIDSILMSYQGVVSSDCGHINVHEAGAVESCGHKVIELKSTNGKISAKQLEDYLLDFHNDETNPHIVQPGMVYITFPTEFGTIYSKSELSNIYSVCKKYSLPLFIDGARLGYGLMCHENDIAPKDLTNLCDVFYIGGTKIGAMCGEAVVFTHHNASPYFFTIQKQHGAVMAKGRFLGIQFDTLFTDNLYMKISRNAIFMAEKMQEIFRKREIDFYISSPTNQQFVILSNDRVEALDKKIIFSHIAPYDSLHTICRFVTSWATTQKDLDYLEQSLDG